MKTKNHNQFLKSLILGLVLFGVACTEMQAGEFNSKSSNIEKVLSDTLIIPFGKDWGGGNGSKPTSIVLPVMVQANNHLYVINNTSASIPYYIIKNDNNAMMEQGTMNLIPHHPYIIDISKWDDGDYTMYITIAGIQFYGTFSIE